MVTLNELTDDDSGGSDTEQLHLMNLEYEEVYDEPIIHLFCRTQDNQFKHVEVEGHKPSFYIHEDAFGRQVRNHQWVDDYETGHEAIGGQPLVKVYTSLPKHVGGTYDSKGLRDYFDDTWEADVWYCNRFLIDTGIKTTFEVDTSDANQSEYVDGEYRVSVDALSPIDVDWQADPRIITVDIEVESSNGFPEPETADQPVTAITAHDNYTDDYTVWVLRHESWTYSDTEVQNIAIDNRPDGVSINDVQVFENESVLLDDFNKHVAAKRPDLLGGWNSSGELKGSPFDYPYLINRCESVNVLSYNDWSPTGDVWNGSWGPSAKGVSFFDMMDGYMKTQFSEPKGGLGLENISENELGGEQAKLELEDIDSAWRDSAGNRASDSTDSSGDEPVGDLATFIEYNIRDVQAVVGIDRSVGAIDLYQNLRKLTGAQWNDCHNNIDLLDVYILRFAHNEGVALPTNEEPERGWFYGGYNFTPKFGRHKNGVYPDVWSMYPNGFRTCNMSPETIIGTKEDLAESEYTEDDCRWSYIDTRPDNVKNPDHMKGAADPEYEKCYYLKPDIKEGFMNKVVDHMMGLKDKYDGTDLYGPVKQIANSTFGIFGDADSYGKGYRLFDWRVGESITLYGRKVIQYTADEYVNALNELKDEYGYDGNNAYRVAGDTDSVITSIPFMDADDREDQQEIVELAQEACEMVNESYDEFAAETFNSDGTYIELEIESYAPWLYVPEPATANAEGKKRYAEIIAWDEGEWIDPPEFSVTGIDVVRSDRAQVTRELVSDVLETILRVDDREQAREEAYDLISTEVDKIKNGERPPSWIARPKGMSQPPHEYGSIDKSASATYKGAKYANQNFDWENLGEGDKPHLLYIEKVRGDWPKTYTADTAEDGTRVDAVSLSEPDKLPDGFEINTEKMIEKTIEDPLTPILSAMNWSVEESLLDTTQQNIDAFM